LRAGSGFRLRGVALVVRLPPVGVGVFPGLQIRDRFKVSCREMAASRVATRRAPGVALPIPARTCKDGLGQVGGGYVESGTFGVCAGVHSSKCLSSNGV